MTPTDSVTGVLGKELEPLRGYGLGSTATILVVGAYEGKTVAVLNDLYSSPTIHGFEPQAWAYERAVDRHRDNPNVHLHNYGLGEANRAAIMGEYGTDACSFLPMTGQREYGPGLLRDVRKVWADLRLAEVDLVLMNIEGYEHILLPVMARAGLLHLCRWLLVQLHGGYVPLAQEGATKAAIDRTHVLHWAAPRSGFWSYQRREL